MSLKYTILRAVKIVGGALVLLLLYLLGTGTLGDFIDLARAYFRH